MIALATCDWLPEGLEAEAGLRDALDARWVVWDDAAVDWNAFELVVVRSTWDYTTRSDAFLTWAGSLPRVANPPEILAFSADKAYLGDLAAAGLPTVPTRFVAPGEQLGVLPGGPGEVVVKPSVGSGSRRAARFAATDAAGVAAHVSALHADGLTAMLQPYLPSVDLRGETALLFAGGAFSHAVGKTARLARGRIGSPPGDPHGPLERREPSPAERRVAGEVLAWVAARFGAAPVYARVDLIEDAAGAPVVLELELVEPNLFLELAPEAVERFAAAFRAVA